MNKLYFKNINLNSINHGKIFKKNEFSKVIEYYILTNNGKYIYLNDQLFNIKNHFKIKDETENYCLIETNINKKKCSQIPIDNIKLTLVKYKIKIGNNLLIFEIIDNKLYDFYLLTNSSNLENYFLNNEISYIEKMFI